MSNEKKTEINWIAVIVAIVCFVNMYWAFTGKWGLRDKEEPEPVLGFICLLVGLTFLYVSSPKESK